MSFCLSKMAMCRDRVEIIFLGTFGIVIIVVEIARPGFELFSVILELTSLQAPLGQGSIDPASSAATHALSVSRSRVSSTKDQLQLIWV
jgi:hypothetical protein